jgi:hypothetical protein
VNTDEALREVHNLGHSYFYDEVDAHTDEEILTWIQEDIQSTRLTGLSDWEQWRDALQISLAGSSDKNLNDILLQSYALLPEEVGGSRQFLSRLHKVIAGAIEKQRRQ